MKIKIRLHYSSPFKLGHYTESKRPYKVPKRTGRFRVSFSNIKTFYKSPRVLCKSVIILLIRLRRKKLDSELCSNKRYFFKNINIFYKPNFRTNYTFLRAPYRYKIARNQVSIKRFYFCCSLLFEVDSSFSSLILSKSFRNLFRFNKLLLSAVKDIDTSVAVQSNSQLTTPYTFSNFFILKNYKPTSR